MRRINWEFILLLAVACAILYFLVSNFKGLEPGEVDMLNEFWGKVTGKT
ncbi:MAG: hypothetical protein ABH851_05815 [Methanobacteriota archaeon]